MIVRPYLSQDASRIVEIYRNQEPDGIPLTIERHHNEFTELYAKQSGEAWVATNSDVVVGYGTCGVAWWTGREDVYTVEVRVDQAFQGCGIGESIYRQMLSFLVSRGAKEILSKVREDCPRGRAFASRFRFQETGEVIEDYLLDVQVVSLNAIVERTAALSQFGIDVRSLAELDADDRDLLQSIHLLWADLGADVTYTEALSKGFASWRSQVLEGMGMSPETFWLAMEGDKPIGMTFLKRITEADAENDYTCVSPEQRGKGIAYTLKLCAIDWAKRNGVLRFHTSSEANNRAMIATNTRLGYRAGARRLELCCSDVVAT